MARIVLVTVGSLGDLHPFIAMGRALVAQGQDVVLAVPEDSAEAVRGAGIEAVPVLPSFATIRRRLGMSEPVFAARVLGDPRFAFDQVLMPSLAESAAALDTVATGADAMAGSLFAFAAEIVAEKRGVPLASVILQPMTLFSAWTPPVSPGFGMMRHRPRTAWGAGWNRLGYGVARQMLRRRYGGAIDAVRAMHGLAPARRAPMLDHGPAVERLLCCWSGALSPLPPDAPARAVQTGFPLFDGASGANEALDPALASFLEQGSAPLVFTLGSFAVLAAGRFYAEAAAASRVLGMRAVLLTGGAGPARLEGDCLYLSYAPHSALFPRAVAVIHHGGIGTTGQALLAGRPQLVVPHFGDQFDNAARLVARGVARTLRRERLASRRVAAVLRELIDAPATAAACADAAAVVAGEDGARAAAQVLLGLAERRPVARDSGL